jgi:hypothetical protein
MRSCSKDEWWCGRQCVCSDAKLEGPLTGDLKPMMTGEAPAGLLAAWMF